VDVGVSLLKQAGLKQELRMRDMIVIEQGPGSFEGKRTSRRTAWKLGKGA